KPTTLPSVRATAEVCAKSRHHSKYAYAEFRSSTCESRVIRYSSGPSATTGVSISNRPAEPLSPFCWLVLWLGFSPVMLRQLNRTSEIRQACSRLSPPLPGEIDSYT